MSLYCENDSVNGSDVTKETWSEVSVLCLWVRTEDDADDGQPAEGDAAERSADGEHDIGGGEGRGDSQHGGGD